MRGRPYIQWIVFVCFWTLLLVPLYLVTRGTDASATPVVSDSQAIPSWVLVRFSSEPERFELFQDSKSLWKQDKPAGLSYEKEVSLNMDVSGAELRIKTELNDTITAIEVVVEPDGRAERSKTVWVRGSVDEVISFSWGNHND